VPKLSTPTRTLNNWNGDPLPLLLAAEAAGRVLAEADVEVRYEVTLEWEGGRAVESSLADAREALRFAAPVTEVTIQVRGKRQKDSADPAYLFATVITNTTFGSMGVRLIQISASGEDFDLMPRVVEAAVDLAQKAVVADPASSESLVHASKESSIPDGSPPSSPPQPVERRGIVARIEAVPVVAQVIVGLLGLVVIVVIAIATN
jgi:hypothetical protein